MKKTLSRYKNKIYPKVPDSIENIREKFEDMKIMEKYGYNLESDSKFYIDTVVTSHYSFTVFASKFVIDFIEKNIEPASRKFLMDATFDSLPKDFYQLLIISIEYQNDVSKVNLVLLIDISTFNHSHMSVRPIDRSFTKSLARPFYIFRSNFRISLQ